MRKIKTFIYLFITFIFLSSPIDAKASSVALTTESLNLLNNGIDFLSYSGSVPYGFLPFVFSSEKNYQNVLEDMMQKQDVFIVDGNANIQIRPLSQNEYSLLENAYIYDDNGDIVSLSDLYYGTVDNGYFTEKFYCKNDGTIVYQDITKEIPYIDVKFGGSEYSYLQWQNTYDSLSDSLDSTGYNYSLNQSITPESVYINVGYYWNSNTKWAGYIYIPSGFVKGKVTYSKLSNQLEIYTNDLDLIAYEQYYPSGNNGSQINVSTGSYTIDNDTYLYSIKFNNLFATDITTNSYSTYQDFINNPTRQNYVFARQNYSQNSAILNNNETVAFKKVINNADTLDLSKSYSISSLDDYVDVLTNTVPYPNYNFDNTQSISELNYPIVNDIDDSISDVVIPFPDSIDIDDSPAIDYPLTDTIDPTLITNNIPIVQGLQNKFPFSIPWDIYNLINGLSVTRETPSIQQTIEIPIINYEWEIDLDLSMYDDSAELFRRLFLILFIIGLAVFSYQHFFGS